MAPDGSWTRNGDVVCLEAARQQQAVRLLLLPGGRFESFPQMIEGNAGEGDVGIDRGV